MSKSSCLLDIGLTRHNYHVCALGLPDKFIIKNVLMFYAYFIVIFSDNFKNNPFDVVLLFFRV